LCDQESRAYQTQKKKEKHGLILQFRRTRFENAEKRREQKFGNSRREEFERFREILCDQESRTYQAQKKREKQGLRVQRTTSRNAEETLFEQKKKKRAKKDAEERMCDQKRRTYQKQNKRLKVQKREV